MGNGEPQIIEIPERGLDGGAGGFLMILATALVILAGVIGCQAITENRAAQERAEGNRAYQEALAYQVRERAEAEADAERAQTRQMELSAAHQRALDTLPYFAGMLGIIVIGVVVMLFTFDLLRRYQPRQGDPALLLFMDQWRLELAERDRALWGALAHLARRLPAVDQEVVPYRED